jgi:hypothetical protein
VVTISAPAGTIYYSTDGSDPREMWTSNAVGETYAAPLMLSESITLRARALDNGEWSALTEEIFLFGTLASAGNAVVSEIMYNPAGEGMEFIELANVSDGPVDFSGVRFGAGIDYQVPTGTVVPAGGFLLIGELEFGNGTALDNDGETIELLAADGSMIESFRYDDDAPWPESPDGLGPSLTRILRPNDPADPGSWRPSVSDGGSPDASDASEFVGDPDSDGDGDGLVALLEHAFGTSDSESDFGGGLFEVTADGGVELTIQQSLAADDVEWSFESSDDLQNWSPATSIELLGFLDQRDGTALVTFSAGDVDGQGRFWRARAGLE